MSYSPYTNPYQTEINKQVGKTAQSVTKFGAVAFYQAIVFVIKFFKEMIQQIFSK